MLEQRLISSLTRMQQCEHRAIEQDALLVPNKNTYAAGMQVPLHPGVALPGGADWIPEPAADFIRHSPKGNEILF